MATKPTTPRRPGLRPLPAFQKWPGGLWCFVLPQDGKTYFAAELTDGWAVAPESDQAAPLVRGHKKKAAAVRAAMDVLEADKRRARFMQVAGMLPTGVEVAAERLEGDASHSRVVLSVEDLARLLEGRQAAPGGPVAPTGNPLGIDYRAQYERLAELSSSYDVGPIEWRPSADYREVTADVDEATDLVRLAGDLQDEVTQMKTAP